MHTVEEITLELPHITLAAKKWGSNDKPIIVATHGWLDNANSFVPLAALLDDFCIIAFDWPGHGCSEHRQLGYPLHITDYVLDLDLVIAKVKAEYNTERICLLSHSFGGIISVMYASLFPENIDRLILLDILTPIYEPESNANNRLQQSINEHRRSLINKKTLKSYESIDSIAKIRAKVTDLDFENAKLIIERNLKQADDGYIWSTDPKLKHSSSWRYSINQIKEMIGSVTIPVLAIFGNRSQAQQQLKTFQHHFDNLEFHIIDGGHHIHMDNPLQVSSFIRCFYAQS